MKYLFSWGDCEPYFTIMDDGEDDMPEKTDPGKMRPEELERMRKAGYDVRPSEGKVFMPTQPKTGKDSGK